VVKCRCSLYLFRLLSLGLGAGLAWNWGAQCMGFWREGRLSARLCSAFSVCLLRRVSSLLYSPVPNANNNRVLEFKPPFATGMAASVVVGQADFNHGSSNQGGGRPTSATLNCPHQVAFDSSGRLLVTDSLNNRTFGVRAAVQQRYECESRGGPGKFHATRCNDHGCGSALSNRRDYGALSKPNRHRAPTLSGGFESQKDSRPTGHIAWQPFLFFLQ